jgi:hypothetical protein
VTQISIPGGQGSTPPITFTITGNAAINLASDFNAGVQNASTITSLSSSRDESTVVGALNLIESSATTLYGLSTGHQYTYAAVTSPTRITGSSTGGDTILAGGGVTYDAVGARNRVVFYKGNNVFNGDSVGGDVISAALGSAAGTIFGGTGVLGFVAGASSTTLPITIVGGSGTTYIFANSGSDISLENSTGRAFIIAGGGNETLNGAAAVGGFAFFGDTVAADASSIDQTIVGGQGADYFSTGGGNETVTSGSGAALFHVNDLGSGTNITIANVSSHDFFNFGGLPVSTEQALLAHDTSVSGGNLNLTLPDGTKVEFLNVTTFTGHLT